MTRPEQAPGCEPGQPTRTDSNRRVSWAEGEATAEWLGITVTRPGSEPEVARRTVFDRVPADIRYGGTPTIESVGPITLVDLDGSGSADYPPMRGVKAFAIATGPTRRVAALADEDGLNMLAGSFHLLRGALGADIALDAGARTFLDGPNIVSLSVESRKSISRSALQPRVPRWMSLIQIVR